MDSCTLCPPCCPTSPPFPSTSTTTSTFDSTTFCCDDNSTYDCCPSQSFVGWNDGCLDCWPSTQPCDEPACLAFQDVGVGGTEEDCTDCQHQWDLGEAFKTVQAQGMEVDHHGHAHEHEHEHEEIDHQAIAEMLDKCCCGFNLPALPPLSTSFSLLPFPAPAPPSFPCKWSQCSLSFPSLSLLTSHVNHIHLNLPDTEVPLLSIALAESGGVEKCLWDDCTASGEGRGRGRGQGQERDGMEGEGNLVQHLVEEHLKALEKAQIVPVLASRPSHDHPHPHPHPHPLDHPHVHPHPHPHPHPDHSHPHDHSQLDSKIGKSHTHHHHSHRVHRHPPQPYGVHPRRRSRSSSPSSSLPSSGTGTVSPPTSLSSPVAGEYECHWQECEKRFGSTKELMEHLSEDHVGKGKNRYQCIWRECGKGEGKTFVQRQKLMRHLQMHTGDRPFVCEVCKKSFSEATTLTQHKRVHTNERPYTCTYEKCGKSFALASALTIHLRTHTGSRPFACPHPGCTSSFAESSNLSKHVRTHKGERNWVCGVEGCEKRFGRSDQLKRHEKVHLDK